MNSVVCNITVLHLLQPSASVYMHSMHGVSEWHALQGRFMVAFSTTVDAIRFCHATQTYILYARWPHDASDMFGPTERLPDGRLLFKGPRVAMAVHETDDFRYRLCAGCHASMWCLS